MARARTRVQLNADELPLVEYGINATTDGFIFYVAKGGRHVHLTAYTKNGRVNAHITDTSKDPPKVWEMDVDQNQMLKKAVKALERSIQRYNWNETYHVVDTELVKAVGLPVEINGLVPSSMNLLDPLRYFSLKRKVGDLSYIRRIPMRDGLKGGPVVGFQLSKTQTYTVIPVDENRCIRMNSSWRRGFMQYLPMYVGLHKYLIYVDREKLIDWKTMANDPRMRERINAILEQPNQNPLVLETGENNIEQSS